MFSQLKGCQSHKSISNPKKLSTNFLEYLGLKPLFFGKGDPPNFAWYLMTVTAVEKLLGGGNIILVC